MAEAPAAGGLASEGDSLDAGLAAAFGAPPTDSDVFGELESAASGGFAPLGRSSYRIEGEIARGGMGLILKARDTHLGRDVALKVLREDLVQRPEIQRRFVEEAQIGGQLQHPGIVPVYELGRMAEGRPYFAMKLIEGRTLAALLAQADEAGRRELLGVFEKVCQAIAFAHARGVVHRDLKPANVLLGAFGEVQVVDWGLAKVLGAPPRAAAAEPGPPPAPAPAAIATVRSGPSSGGSRSLAGAVMGTPAYMPPEQARGDVELLDERSDVFALGAILCELLTGAPPYSGEAERTLEQAAAARLEDATRRLAQCDADAELVRLCRACLAPDPADRPRTAAQVAERLHAHLVSVEERAHAARVRAAEARVRAKAVVLLAAGALAVVLLAVGGWLWMDAQRSRRLRDSERAIAAALQDAKLASGGHDWAAAAAALERARGRLEGGDASDELRAQVEVAGAALAREADEARRAAELEAGNAALVADLDDLRQPEGDTVYPNDWSGLDARYAALFERHGLEIDAGAEDQAAQALAERGIPLALSGALDDWSAVRRRAGDAHRAERLARLAAALDPDPMRAELRAALAGGDTERVRALARDADPHTWPPATLRRLARALRADGDYAATLQLLGPARRAHPGDFGLAMEHGRALRHASPPRAQEAAAAYEVALALRPHSVEPWHELGMTLLSYLQRPAEALELFREAVARRPLDGHLHFHVANALTNLGRDREAVDVYARAIELEPDFALSHCNLGLSLHRLGRAGEAMASYERALELDPDFAVAHHNLGGSLRRMERFEEALAHFERALEVDPSLANSHFERGYALFRLDRVDEAIASYGRARELPGCTPSVHQYLGLALERAGRIDEAAEAFARAVQVAPTDRQAHKSLAWILATASGAARDPALAVVHARRALELAPQGAEELEILGIALYASGDDEAALEALEGAVARGGETPSRLLFLALCNARLGDEAAARACFERAEPDLDALARSLSALAPFVAEARTRLAGGSED